MLQTLSERSRLKSRGALARHLGPRRATSVPRDETRSMSRPQLFGHGRLAMRVGPRAYSVGPPEKTLSNCGWHRGRGAHLVCSRSSRRRPGHEARRHRRCRGGGARRAHRGADRRTAAPAIGRLEIRPNPYTGDPINYIRFAREMQGFYQPHVREPMFLALTRGFLHLLNNRDFAVSYASAFSSSLVVPAIYLLGAAALGRSSDCSRPARGRSSSRRSAGARAAGATTRSRFSSPSSAWSYVRLRQDLTPSSAIAAGIAAAAACLTRLSSLLFVAAGLVWVIVEPASNVARAHAARMAAIAALMATLVAGPYVASCWRATGDPFYAVNYHTRSLPSCRRPERICA